jgi:hypothetical protein
MHTKASQKRARMMSGGMPEGGIRIAASPSQERSTVNDEIAGSDESRSECLHNSKHKQ